MCIEYGDDPPYDTILSCLFDCFYESLGEQQTGLWKSDSHSNYRFEWNRNIASRVRDLLIAEADIFCRAVDVSLCGQDSII